MREEAVNGKNIILIGMPGAGKTTVGALLAKKLGRTFVDTDELIRKADGRELKDIVAEEGLERFLEIQNAAIMQSKFKDCVIATGGGVVKSDDLMQYLKMTGVIIYLRQEPDILEQRLAPGRRLARADGQTFRQLFEEREPLYVMYADRIVDCGEKTPEKIALEIINE
jgi:shikimate kinase